MSADWEAFWSASKSTEWIVAARGGSRPALDRLLEACSRYLLAVAKRDLGAALRSRLDPVDIVQDTLMRAWQRFAQFRGTTHAEWLAWLRRILRRTLANERRRHVRTVMRSLRREVPLAGVVLVQRPDRCAQQAWTWEQREMLEGAVGRLPERYRQVIQLHTWKELNFFQVGERLHCSAEAARKLWRRAADELALSVEAP